MAKFCILVVDDDTADATSWRAKISSSLPERIDGFETIEVVTLGNEDLKRELAILYSRNPRNSVGSSVDQDLGQAVVASIFDTTSVLVVDYDLLAVWQRDGRVDADVTGESVAYLARCFSSCGFIVTLNQFTRGPVFDLNLRGRPSSFADLNIPSAFIGAKALWNPDEPTAVSHTTEFAPWYWPNIPKATKDFEVCVNQLQQRDGAGLDQLCGIDREDFGYLPVEMVEYLLETSPGQLPGEAFATIELSEVARRAMRSMRPKDDPRDDYLLRVVAARIRAWIHWVVLSAQMPYSDFPHVVARLPELLLNPQDEATLQALVTKKGGTSLLQNLKPMPSIDAYCLPANQLVWWPVPVVNWRRMVEDPEIIKLQVSQSVKLPQVFCEDISRFVDKSRTRRFKSNVLSAYQTRYVCNPQSIQLTLGGSPTGIEYAPAQRLAL